jgi:hypothetical protein
VDEERLERFQQRLVEQDKENKKKRNRSDFEFFKPVLEEALSYLEKQRQEVLDVLATIKREKKTPGGM